MLKSKLITLKSWLHNPFYWDKNQDTAHTIIISGVGRGGTTWLSELINYQNDFRYIFEPLHTHKVGIVKDFDRREYFPIGIKNNKTAVLEQILKGKVRGYWVDHYNTVIFPKRRLIKFIRANLLLGWINQNHPEIPIILMIRNPFATVLSQMNGNWNVDLNQLYLNNKLFVNDYLLHKEHFLNSLTSKFEKHFAMWCIDTSVALLQLQGSKVHICFYEHLITQPEKELKAIFTHINLPYNSEVLAKINKPSRIVGRGYTHQWGLGLLKKWEEKINPSDFEIGIKMLQLFNLSHLYPDGVMPFKN